MSGLFGSKTPALAPTPPPPSYDDAAIAGQQKTDELRKRRGMAATILAGSAPQSTTQPQTQAASLLGS